MKQLFVCLPLYSRLVDIAVAKRFFLAKSDRVLIHQTTTQCSLLPHGFNMLWQDAQRKDFDYFLMLHADVEPIEHDWVDILVGEMDATGADLLGAVIALKDSRGMTSTAIGSLEDPWKRTRLTLSQCSGLPETFSARDCGCPDRPLLINTGCMLIDLRKPWVENAWFQINNRINGESVECEPEDWFFSRQAFEAGAKAYATRKVRTYHHGDVRFPSWCTEDNPSPGQPRGGGRHTVDPARRGTFKANGAAN
jgi:hypothetical protein